MTREEAKKLINECGLNINEPLHSEVLEIVNEVLTVGEWIPCSERLPNHPNQVLITIKWDSPFDNDYEVTLGEYWGEEYGWGFENGEVLAWMSLPEPYKG